MPDLNRFLDTLVADVNAGTRAPGAPTAIRQAHQRRRKIAAAAAAVVAVIVLGATAVVGGQDRAGPDGLEPVEQPDVVVGDEPVWYDARGLHRGDVVEQTPVEIGERNGDDLNGALALVRSGAVYLDPTTGDVWFHPWAGDPRVVGHNSEAGPGGDPNGDTAAWFEGSDALNDALYGGPGELVVYDTAAGREISRTLQSHGVSGGQGGIGGDYFRPGNGFLQVSAERVVWTSGPKMYVHDVRTQNTSEVKVQIERYLADVHDDVEVLGEGGSGVVVLRVPGRPEERYPELTPHVRLSPSGNYLLAVEFTEERHGAAIVDTRTGELWRVPKDAYPWIAWSYGDIAMVDTEDELLACDAARRACESLPAERPFLMPTN